MRGVITARWYQKDDLRDAVGLAQALRLGAIERQVPKYTKQFRELKELARVYCMVTSWCGTRTGSSPSRIELRIPRNWLCPLRIPHEAIAQRGPDERLVLAERDDIDALSSPAWFLPHCTRETQGTPPWTTLQRRSQRALCRTCIARSWSDSFLSSIFIEGNRNDQELLYQTAG